MGIYDEENKFNALLKQSGHILEGFDRDSANVMKNEHDKKIDDEYKTRRNYVINSIKNTDEQNVEYQPLLRLYKNLITT